ncbi:hypothetical protein ACS2QC_28385 [Bacillus cereus group sp. Bce033]|uniref:hypothetical protein n=1 Tax=Bacillus TaxID=1386 RepID=UPI000F4EC9E8|nr:hypothetical protein [Bacillus sp. FDAARGOS_527]AYY25035.1 hypothetical protein EGX95_00005 [Bacillus sp. FDAARGOS_527]
MADKISVVVEDPKTIEFERTNDGVTMKFDGNKEIVFPVKVYTKEVIHSQIVNPSVQELDQEYKDFRDNKVNISGTYYNLFEEIEALEENYEQMLLDQCSGKCTQEQVDGAAQALHNAKMKRDSLEKVNKNLKFKSKYTKEEMIKSHYEGIDKVLGEHYRYNGYYLPAVEKLAQLIKINVVEVNYTAGPAMDYLRRELLEKQREYDGSGVNAFMVGPTSDETYEKTYPYKGKTIR